jgi:hypothetical protein
MTPEMAAGVDVAQSNGERSRPGGQASLLSRKKLRQLRSTARLKMRCFAVKFHVEAWRAPSRRNAPSERSGSDTLRGHSGSRGTSTTLSRAT